MLLFQKQFKQRRTCHREGSVQLGKLAGTCDVSSAHTGTARGKEDNMKKKDTGFPEETVTNIVDVNDMDEKIQWHPAFCFAMRLEFKDTVGLSFDDEYQLTSKPLQIDLMIVRKSDDVIISNKIGHIFRKHNIIEYKSPDDGFNLKTFYKTQGYACLYMVSSRHSEAVNSGDVTVTMVRNSKPVKMMKQLVGLGFEIEKRYDGIYYIKGALFDTQIIVSSELDDRENKWIKSLNRNISKTLYMSIYEDMSQSLDENQIKMADNIMHVVSDANEEIIKKWKGEDDTMGGALWRIMQPEIDEVVEKAEYNGELRGKEIGIQQGKIAGLIEAYYKCGKSVEEITELTGQSPEYVREILNELIA